MIWRNYTERCPICKDSHVREIRDTGKGNVFGYPEEEAKAEIDHHYFPGSD